MARRFTSASSEKLTFGLGQLGFVFGPGTLCAIINHASAQTGIVISSGSVSNPSWEMSARSTGAIGVGTNGSVETLSPSTLIGTSQWVLIAVSKATGSVPPRFHTYVYSTNSWTHENAAGNLGNSGTPTTESKLGCTAASATFFNGDIAVAGAWNVVLTDAQVEALAYDLRSWFAPAQPQAFWVLDQDAVAQTVPDLSGGGANQSARVGTTLSTTSVPVWSRGGEIRVLA